MCLEKQSRGRRTSVGTECARLWRWEWVGHKWRCCGLLSHRRRKCIVRRRTAWLVCQPKYASCFPSLNSCGDQPSVSVRRPTESRNLAPLQTMLTRGFFQAIFKTFCWKTSLNPLTEDRCLPEQISALTQFVVFISPAFAYWIWQPSIIIYFPEWIMECVSRVCGACCCWFMECVDVGCLCAGYHGPSGSLMPLAFPSLSTFTWKLWSLSFGSVHLAMDISSLMGVRG